MIYLATPSGAVVQEAIADGLLGQMVTYKSANLLVPGATFAIDNGVVRIIDGQPVTDTAWSVDRWQRSLDRYMGVPGCLFAVIPDAVGDAAETDRLWRRWAPAASRRGYRCAYVAQDGCTRLPAGAEAVFLGGTDHFKLGQGGRDVAEAAKASGRWLHMGRVNTRQRLRLAKALGCDSVDGTTLGWGPDRNLPDLLRWLAQIDTQEALPL